MPSPIHLHLLWNVKGAHGWNGAKALQGVVSGFGICGAREVPRDQLTAFLDDTTCEACIKRAATDQAAGP